MFWLRILLMLWSEWIANISELIAVMIFGMLAFNNFLRWAYCRLLCMIILASIISFVTDFAIRAED